MPTTFGIYLAGLLGTIVIMSGFFWRLVTVATSEADKAAPDQLSPPR